MTLKSVVELKASAVENAKQQTVESICFDISEAIGVEANMGGRTVEHCVHSAVTQEVLTKVGVELVKLGYKFECDVGEGYYSLVIAW